ncbi:MAG: glycosyltransferase family 2 protein [Methylovulum miyakonense]|uniref:glycosyltransferase n=1 Tax=Methylovulum miyakonense TaxID=645578 RepID=UPI003BB4E1E2
MSNKLPTVCIFGATGLELRSAPVETANETTALSCHCFSDDSQLEKVLIEHAPHVIVSFGDLHAFPKLMAAPFEIRRRWLHYPDTHDLAKVGSQAFYCYLSMCLDKRDEQPLVSVFTPTYKTGPRFERAFRSLLGQAYPNWEWIIVDDSDDDGETYRMVQTYAAQDHRIRPFKPDQHSGIIGEVKYMACALSRGDLLVELDHDDELTPSILQALVTAYRNHPDAGFFYSDFSEVDSQLNPLVYGEGWGFGYGSYRDEWYCGHCLKVVNAPNINPKTIRHLVAAPNHVRAWTRDCYTAIGGHNRFLHVADDFELLVRTFLHTAMVRVPVLGYLQYIEGGANTQRVRNQDIQRHVRYVRWKYDRRIHERFLALGLNDWVWVEEGGYSDLDRPNPQEEPVASVIAKI